MPDYQSELDVLVKLFETMPVGCIVFRADDPEFTIVSQNAAHEELSMTSKADTIGKPVLQAFPDTSDQFKKTGKSELVESFRRVVKTKAIDEMPTLHYDLQDKDGNWIEKYWSVSHYPIADTTGRVTYIYQVTRDITSETTSSQRLKVVERDLDRALAVGGVSIWNWDLKTDKVYGDKNLAFLFGYSESDVVEGLSLAQFTDSIHPDDRSRIQKSIKKTLADDSLYEVEYRTINRGGAIRWVIARGQIERSETGKPLSFPGAIVDITERKLAEKNILFLLKASTVLASSLNYKKTLQQAAKVAVEEFADWCTIELNENNRLKLVALAHRDPAKVKWARQLRQADGMSDIDDESGTARVLRTGKAEFYPEITDDMLKMGAKDQEEYQLLKSLGMDAVITVPLTVSGETIGVMSLISSEQGRHYTQSDLEVAQEVAVRAANAISNSYDYATTKKELAAKIKLQQQLAEANERLEARVKKRTLQLENTNLSLERSNRELENFAYVASHDLQEPLRKIQAFGNLLESEYSEQLGQGSDYLERMRAAAVRMSALINDLLAFSRVATKQQPMANVAIGSVIEGVLSDLEDLIKRTDGKVTVGKMPEIMADPMQMRQLFQNLIANALKFHHNDIAPLVSVSAKKVGSNYQFEVSDNGVGFDEKYLDRVFAVFQRLNGRDEFEGTGIGLAVCRKIVERHGGTITAKSKPGEGATFLFTLPISQSEKGDV